MSYRRTGPHSQQSCGQYTQAKVFRKLPSQPHFVRVT